MLTRSTLKLIRSLDTRKGRRREGLFVAEGPKLVGELLGHFVLRQLFVADDVVGAQASLLHGVSPSCLSVVSSDELSRASLQQTPQGVLALFKIPRDEADFASVASSSLTLALDDVQDPGNLGTIVRLADWFGVSDIWCTPATADIWSPKAIQATMGGIARVRVHIINNLSLALASLPAAVPVYGTSLHGEALWHTELAPTGVIVLGNEGRGVCTEVEAQCRCRLLIPNYPAGRPTTESLNVATATGIVLAEFRRRCYSPSPIH